jgi:hypothetical protein
MSKRIASKAKAKRALRKGHHSGYKLGTASKNKGNAKKGAWAVPSPKKKCKCGASMIDVAGDYQVCNKCGRAFHPKDKFPRSFGWSKPKSYIAYSK